MIGYENGRAHILVAASLPANSYAVYDVRTGGSEKTISPSAASAIENSVYKITLDKNGDIISLTDKQQQQRTRKRWKSDSPGTLHRKQVVRMACMGNPERDHRP